MNVKKRVVSWLLTATMILSMPPVSVFASDTQAVLERVVIAEESGAAVVSSGTCGENLTWTLNDVGTLTISGVGSMEDYDHYDNTAPWDIWSVEKVVIKEGITSVGDYAFYEAENLTSIQLPAGVTSIGDSAFYYCSSLTSIQLPDSVTSIGEKAFYGCSSLASIQLPAGMTSINYATFFSCSSLTSIRLPDSVTYIDSSAFSYCRSLSSVQLPDSVTAIGYYAFGGCSSLTSIQLPDSVTDIGSSAFSGCSSLTSIQLPAGVTSIGSSVFSDCSSLTSIQLPDSVTAIGSYAFKGCSSLASIQLPDSVTDIGNFVFRDCRSLTSIQLPAGVTSIGSSAFRGCSNLTDIYYAGTMEKWIDAYGGGIFDTVIHCSDGEIRNTWKLDDAGTLTISGVGYMADYYYNYTYDEKTTPWDNSQVKKVVIEEGITSVGDRAFYQAENLTEVSLPDSLTCIGYGAFEDCSGLETIEIPDAVTEITYSAFWGSKNLKKIRFMGNAPEIARNSFYEVEANAYYPADNATWTSNKRVNYGGSLNWIPFSTTLDAPTVSTSNDASTGKIKLTWDAVDDAVKYKVYRATSKTGEYKLMKTTTGTSYTNTGSVAGEKYYYYVVAEKANGLKSDRSNIVSRTCDLPRPVVTASNDASTGKIKLTWDAIDGAVGYKVYRATSKSGTYKLMKTTTGTTYTNTSAEAGTAYYYKVVAVHEKSAANSAYSVVKSRTCDLARPEITLTNVASSGKIKVSWEKVAGAKEYKVYRATSKNGTYKLMKTTTGTSYTNTSAEAGTAYYYKVVAVHSNSAANSAYSEVKSRTCDLARPVVSVKLNTSGKPVVSWKAVDGAEKYKVYAYNSNGDLIKSTSVTGTKMTHSAAAKGKTYTYSVVAVHSNTAANSAKSTAVSIKSK